MSEITGEGEMGTFGSNREAMERVAVAIMTEHLAQDGQPEIRDLSRKEQLEILGVQMGRELWMPEAREGLRKLRMSEEMIEAAAKAIAWTRAGAAESAEEKAAEENWKSHEDAAIAAFRGATDELLK